MNIIIFGATGMVGRGVLLEALDSPEVTHVLSVGRRTTGVDHAKLREVVHEDFEDFAPIADELTGLDACLWCLGISSAGLDEATYTRITYTYTMVAAKVLYEQSPGMRFCFVSGAGTDDTEQGRVMWARVKGMTENALKQVGFREVILFRPGFIRPMRCSQPRGTLYRILYAIFGVFDPILRGLGNATSTVEVGRAMIAAALGMSEKQVLNSPDINQLAARFQTQP